MAVEQGWSHKTMGMTYEEDFSEGTAVALNQERQQQNVNCHRGEERALNCLESARFVGEAGSQSEE
jgi:hypothetical protein